MTDKNQTTSWGKVAEWYDEMLGGDADSYQRQVILPNLLRLVAPKAGEKILDLACGSGFFSRELAKAGAEIIGVDIAPELIELAKKQENKKITYFVSPAHQLPMLLDKSLDATIIVLAIQNIAEVKQVLAEVKRVLKSNGRFFIVLNHPAFRIPKASSWGWDEATKTQYRRIDQYLSESKVAVQMHPGLARRSSAKVASDTTISFHRPLQYYFKLLGNAGLAVTRLEEWVSHRQSQTGPRAKVEDKARHEFPLFLCLESRVVC